MRDALDLARPVPPIIAALLPILASAAETSDGAWPLPARDSRSTRFSPLAEIRVDNAARLELAFRFSTVVEKGHEAAPIVVGDTMYVVTPYPNYVFAFDLTKPGANVRGRFG